MKFGLFGSAQAKRGQGPDVDSAKGYRDYLEYNIEAEGLGFYSAFAVEHHFTGFGQVSATLNLMTYLAAQTSTLRLGTAVMVLPWHNPVLLAEQAATVDLLSGGRLDFGVGKGYRYNEFEGFGIPMEEAAGRFESQDNEFAVSCYAAAANELLLAGDMDRFVATVKRLRSTANRFQRASFDEATTALITLGDIASGATRPTEFTPRGLRELYRENENQGRVSRNTRR